MSHTHRSIERVLIPNRGEVAVRLLRGAASAGVIGVVAHSSDDAACLAVRTASETRKLPGAGPAAYLDADAVVAAAVDARCDGVLPGYGFLAEDPSLARACASVGIAFVGPSPTVLEMFGHKARARELARELGVPVLAGSAGVVDLDGARRFFDDLGHGGAMVIKAVAGGGGRGMRVVTTTDGLSGAWERCRSEAESAFGNGDLMVERFAPAARHIEVQVIGDGTGAVAQLGERECSLQRRHQKLIEMAPAPNLNDRTRSAIHSAALTIAGHVAYSGLGTFEFLVFDDESGGEGFAFIEANPRLQVEHTVTEEVTGIDLVRLSLDLAGGVTLEDVGLTQEAVPTPRGVAVEARVNTETIRADGSVLPSTGVIERFEAPSGPGIRVDTHGYQGLEIGSRYDSLLAKIIVTDRTHGEALARLDRALAGAAIGGVATNVGFLRAVIDRPEVRMGEFTTQFIDDHTAELVAVGGGLAPSAPFDPSGTLSSWRDFSAPTTESPVVGDDSDLAVGAGGPRSAGVVAPLQGLVVEVLVAPGEEVPAGAPTVVVEAMKMEHVLEAPTSGVVRAVLATVGQTVDQGALLIEMEQAEVGEAAAGHVESLDPDAIRPDLAELIERRTRMTDSVRVDAVARRHAKGKRTAWENVSDLCDEGSFTEYGGLVVAAQRSTRSFDDLVDRTPHDGIVTGLARINGEPVVVMAYDYTVLAGTQGFWGHRKQDRLLQIAHDTASPLVIFTEGGGGRPSDSDLGNVVVSALDTSTWGHLSKLNGVVPTIGITSGYCFAGNAVLLGMCDVVIATADSNIGVGGPAMIAEAGMGELHPSEIGSHDDQVTSGVIDISVADEAEAVAVAKQYLSYFQGPVDEWSCADQRLLRSVIPENRVRAYDVRRVIDLLADDSSVLELRPGFGLTMVTALARIEGRPVGVIANNPLHLAGAIDSDGSDKVARFMQLCDAFGLPIVSLCDTPGIMVGPEAERTGLVRHASRLFTIGGNLTVPLVTVVLRKAYGLGAQAMSGGHFRAPIGIASWPTGEFGGMGLEGAIRLAFGKELAAIEDLDERNARFQSLVDAIYARSKALNVAAVWEIDDVIDPAETRTWITSVLGTADPDATGGMQHRRGLPGATSPGRPDRGAHGREAPRFIDNW